MGCGDGVVPGCVSVLAECAHKNDWIVKLWAVLPQCAQSEPNQRPPPLFIVEVKGERRKT